MKLSDFGFELPQVTSRIKDEEMDRSIKLDLKNKDFFNAVELVRNTRHNLFITGKAGTGKTTFLKHVRANIDKQTVVLAYTGVAAMNAGGQTIHSFFNINPHQPPFLPGDKRLRTKRPQEDPDDTTIYSHFRFTNAKRETMEKMQLLIIDEVSMVRADFIDVIDRILRAFGPNHGLPFGGVQIILIGDSYQLSPVEGKEWEPLKRLYTSPYFFDAKAFQEANLLSIELKTIYRQTQRQFIDLLNRVRENKPSVKDLSLLNEKVRLITNKDFDENYIVLCSTNTQANQVNLTRLEGLGGEQQTFHARISGDFPESNYPTDKELVLKEGAQVMFLKNGPNYFNGKIGTVVSLADREIRVRIKDQKGKPQEIKVEMHAWDNARFYYNEKTHKIEREPLGSFTQYPLKLAWAITVHKSQGLTFDKVAIDINDFAPSGLAYVALSRCTSLEGLILKQPLRREAINTDRRVLSYSKKAASEEMVRKLLNISEAANDANTPKEEKASSSRKEKKASSVKDTEQQLSCPETLNCKPSAVQSPKSTGKKEKEGIAASVNITSSVKEKDSVTILKMEVAKLNTKVRTLEVDKMQVVATNGTLLIKLKHAEKSVEDQRKLYLMKRHELSAAIDKMKELEKLLENERLENERLRKLTWLQKLLGKK